MSELKKPFLRKSHYKSNIITVIVLAVFVLAVYGFQALVKPEFGPTSLIITGIIIAIIPAILWLVFFYRQDVLEPEPKGMVLQVFVLGGLVAAAVGIPVINAFNLPSWLYNNIWTTIFGSILVVGFTQEFLKYAAVRFSVFSSNEFDERVDGIIYSTAAGLGFATAMNISFIVESGGVDLTMAAIRVVLVALAQASFAGVTGYFMGRDKLENRPAWWMPLGVTIAAVLNGVFYYLWGTLKRPSFSAGGAYINPWTGLILAAVLAVAIMAVLTWLIDRDQQRTLKMLENKEA